MFDAEHSKKVAKKLFYFASVNVERANLLKDNFKLSTAVNSVILKQFSSTKLGLLVRVPNPERQIVQFQEGQI